MNLLTNEMTAAIDEAEITEQDKRTIKAILYQERLNKERARDNDAEKYIIKLIDENSPDEVVE